MGRCILIATMELEITVKELHSRWNGRNLNRPNDAAGGSLCLLDVREPWEAEVCTIAGSTLMPMGEVPSRATEQLDPKAHIVVYCHHGHRSLGAVMWLREQGFERAQSLAGGIEAWARQVDPALARY